MAARASPGDEQRRLLGLLALGLGLLLLAIGPASAGLCPVRCRCDDESLRSSCAYGGLDVVPIQLNPEIRHLDLSGNRIAGLHMAFDFYGSLESLDLGSNLIHTLGSNNFRLQQRLLSLNLSGNAIRALAKTALHGLAALRTLDLSSNNITEVDEQAFRYTSELEWLDLGGNGITSLPAGLLRNLHRIRSLVLKGNSLLEAPASNLALAPSLERLDLSDNLVQELGRDSLPSLPALARLDLANNVLRSIADEAFERTPGLQGLDLSGNNLTSVPSKALARLAVLGALALSKNPLGELRELAFRNLFELRTLELNECAIGRVAGRAFADNVNLERISMEGNRDLTELPARLLYAAGSLRWVSLRRCNLASLQPTHFPVDGLTSLRVGGNPLVCNCSVHWLWNVLRAEERRNGSRLELDSQEIVCADEEFAGKILMSLPEGSLRCRLSPLYLSLSALGCLAATAAILGLVAHVTRSKRRKRVPAYAAPTRPELLVYVGRAGDELPGKHQESYSRRLIARTEDLVYEAANQEYQQSRRKSGSESPESRETNVYETPRYSRPGRREAEQAFGTFYQQQRPPSPTGLSNQQQLGYPMTPETRPKPQEGVYAVADVTNLRHEQPASELLSLYRMRNTGHHHHHHHQRVEDPTGRDYGYDYEYDYDAPLPPQKPHVVFV
ncbi:PREDICTED: insulin-like growth factor-binding protein complex acid labile subunit [Ceratosolen solmsi marchali]|uniref:Insulin-like growth factor-binding protein complex acid labile subunit n=1 Tax=Ceratosolen solmsi marchali TaxID=326594 RepID=A0AAJ6VMF2_9HYME|nr:PREDICTED: insulin-like growth factor-binding protein complex acid labile subunit [Ceratosolen solmsi marchali]